MDAGHSELGNTPPGSPSLSDVTEDIHRNRDQQVDVNHDPSKEGINADPSEEGDYEGPLDLSTRH